MIKSKKEGRFLVFELEGGEKGVVKYDLATQQYIGKKGSPVKNLCSQLRPYKIREVIDSFEDETYRSFLNHVYNLSYINNYNYYNVGTFLTKVSRHSNLEQFFSAGLTNVDVGSTTKISDIPKGLIKYCKAHRNFKLSHCLIINYKKYTDMFNIFFDMEDEVEMFKFSSIAYSRSYNRSLSSLDKFAELVYKSNYNTKSLIKYIDNIMLFEGIENSIDVIELLYDYVLMSKKISPKFEKYPRYLKTVHDIAIRNYNRLKEQFDEEEFNKRRREDFEFKCGDFVFLYPKTTSDIKDEAVQQSNCVASYIKRVINGECHIMFMREKNFKNQSLVTLEITTNDYRVVQARGKFNRDTYKTEKEAIEKFNKHLADIAEKEEKK